MLTVTSSTFVDKDVVHVNDIRVVNGTFATATGTAAYANIIECVIRTRLGELPLDTGRGIPYFETVFQSSRLVGDFEDALRKRVEDLYFVEEVVSVETSLDRERGVLSYTAVIRIADGEEIDVSGSVGERAFINDLIASGGSSMKELVKDGRFYLPVHLDNGIQMYRILTDSVDPDNGVQPAISDELFKKNPTTGAFEEVQQ